jgi:FtsH-binding integral membrane protein
MSLPSEQTPSLKPAASSATSQTRRPIELPEPLSVLAFIALVTLFGLALKDKDMRIPYAQVATAAISAYAGYKVPKFLENK